MAPDSDRTIDWYRTPIDPALLAKLNERSDGRGWIQAGGYLLLMLMTGTGGYLSWRWGPWYATVAALFLHGTVCAFTINAVHELVHGTVFRTSRLNELFAGLFSFLGWHNHHQFWASHAEHHKFTLHPPDDLEVVLPATPTLGGFLRYAVISPDRIIPTLKDHWDWARGLFRGEWNARLLPDPDARPARAVSRWSQFLLAGHGLIAAVSLMSGQWIIPILVTLSPFYGGWLFFLCNNTQHAGLTDNVPDFRLCCRTIHLNRAVRFLYWQMNYHTEHHMYAAVPCYHLHRLHAAIRHELPPTLSGLRQAWTQIGYIMQRQRENPAYQHVQTLPGSTPAATPTPPRSSHPSPASRQDTGRPGRRWVCAVCGFIYDEAMGLPEEGIAPGTAWSDIPDGWRCPDCGIGKEDFEMVEQVPSAQGAR